MRILVESLKRLYESVPQRVTKDELLMRLSKGVITREEYDYIVSTTEEYEVRIWNYMQAK